MSSVVDARTVMETTPARRHHRHHHRPRAAVGVTARARRWARTSVAVTARVDGNVEEEVRERGEIIETRRTRASRRVERGRVITRARASSNADRHPLDALSLKWAWE